jgi:mycofactocin glycosyltransferase
MNPSVKGSFHLRPGTKLIPCGQGGIVFRPLPLRALKVNASAFDLLAGCRNGLSLNEETLGASVPLKAALGLFDRLCQADLLEWKPPDDKFEPFVSIVIAVYNRAGEIGSCIESLLKLDYRGKREIIVVDDGSTDNTSAVVSQYNVRLITQEQNTGQSAARNAGVAVAKGEIAAFIDSDCIAEPGWLRELVPYFQDSRNALVGGYVASFFRESILDRYEEAKSPLNMGETVLTGSGEESDFYVPTCNMLIKKDVYLQVGGLDENLRVGEDVDFCWKLKERGFRLVYVPKGRVRHKHRNQLGETFKRRFDYGTSEPVLYARHKAIFKHYPLQPLCMAVFFLCAWGLIGQQPLIAPAVGLIFLWDVISKKRFYEKRVGVNLTFRTMLRATTVRYFELFYHLTHHLVRYYVLLMIVLAILLVQISPLIAALVLFPPLVQFFKKKPHLSFPAFLILFIVEQGSYQAGAFWACVEQRSFRIYRLVLVTSGQTKRIGMIDKMKTIFRTTGNSPVT